jgi:hypothetical protein
MSYDTKDIAPVPVPERGITVFGNNRPIAFAMHDKIASMHEELNGLMQMKSSDKIRKTHKPNSGLRIGSYKYKSKK